MRIYISINITEKQYIYLILFITNRFVLMVKVEYSNNTSPNVTFSEIITGCHLFET